MTSSAPRPESTRIAVFARAPVPGTVKTRLFPLLGADGAAGLHAGLVRHALSTAVQARVGAVELWCAPDDRHPFFERCAREFGATLRIQRGADLGERMSRAFDATLEEGVALLLIGSDCPAITVGDLQAAARDLSSNDAVLVPAEDGGYVLVGLSTALPAMFERIAWGGAAVMSETRTPCRGGGALEGAAHFLGRGSARGLRAAAARRAFAGGPVVMRAAAAFFFAAASFAFAQDSIAIPAFSSMAPGAQLPGGWRSQRLPKAAPAEVSMVNEDGATVLRVRSIAAAGGAVHALGTDAGQTASRSMLSWQWKVDRVVEKADMTRRAGDDFAARVYVFFAVPANELAFGDRVRIMIARILYGEQLPTAGICYVWDNRHPAGTTAWSPYTNRIRMVVVETGSARAGQWSEVRRDLEADFRAAFAAQGSKPMPPVTGIAAGNDTDQTGESATAWFGDFRMQARR